MELPELHPEDPVQWASLHFAEAELGDARRVKRATQIATALLRCPGESLPRLFTPGREVGICQMPIAGHGLKFAEAAC